MECDFYAPWDDPTRDNCAIYIREGAIIPMREIEQYIGELHSHDKMNPVTFSIYPGRNTSYKMFLDDDGVTNKAETAGQYRLIEISHEGEAGIARVHNRPFARSGHMVRNKLHWDANYAVGLPKQRNLHQSSPTLLCFESPTA